jgi:serine/threonine-protein kinase
MTVLLTSDWSSSTNSLGRSGPGDFRDSLSLTGTIVDGRYLVESVVGQGGFGIVYRVQHLRLDSPVALKVLRVPHRMTHSERDAFVKRFLQEGKLLFRLGSMHPGFVRVFEAGILSGETDDVVPYLAMDWLDGEALDRQLQRMRAAQMPPLDLTAALSLMSAIVESAATAHSLGVAHLDIKPGNIFLSQRGSHVYPRLLDFGIAKMMRANPALADCSAFAARGPRAMTPAYAAPEQWLSDLGPTGPWTDVHALALTLVELLTGERAFKGHSQPQLQAACLATERPTPATFGCRIPARVERVFRRALSLEPRSRFPNARGFWRELCAAADFTPNSSLFVSNERFKLLPDEQSASSTSNSVDPTALSQLFSESCYGNIVRAIAQETSRQTAWRRLGSPKTITTVGLSVAAAALSVLALSRPGSADRIGSEHAAARTEPLASPRLTLSALPDGPRIVKVAASSSPQPPRAADRQTDSELPAASKPAARRELGASGAGIPSSTVVSKRQPAPDSKATETASDEADLLHSNALRQRN